MYRTVYGPSINPQSVISFLRFAVDLRGFRLRLLIICSLGRTILEKYLLLFSEDGNVGTKLGIQGWLRLWKRLFLSVNRKVTRVTEPVLAESRSISISCVRVSQDATHDNSCVRPRVAASLRGREDLAIIQGKWAIAFFVSAFLLCHGNGRRGTKVKGFSKCADSYRQKKREARTFYSTTEVSVFLLSDTENANVRVHSNISSIHSSFTRHERLFSYNHNSLWYIWITRQFIICRKFVSYRTNILMF